MDGVNLRNVTHMSGVKRSDIEALVLAACRSTIEPEYAEYHSELPSLLITIPSMGLSGTVQRRHLGKRSICFLCYHGGKLMGSAINDF